MVANCRCRRHAVKRLAQPDPAARTTPPTARESRATAAKFQRTRAGTAPDAAAGPSAPITRKSSPPGPASRAAEDQRGALATREVGRQRLLRPPRRTPGRGSGRTRTRVSVTTANRPAQSSRVARTPSNRLDGPAARESGSWTGRARPTSWETRPVRAPPSRRAPVTPRATGPVRSARRPRCAGRRGDAGFPRGRGELSHDDVQDLDGSTPVGSPTA